MKLKRIKYFNTFEEERCYGELLRNVGTALKYGLKKGWDRFKYGVTLRPWKWYQKWGTDWQQRHSGLAWLGHGALNAAGYLGQAYVWRNFVPTSTKLNIAKNVGNMYNSVFTSRPGQAVLGATTNGLRAVNNTSLGHRVLKGVATGVKNAGNYIMNKPQ